MAVQGNPFRKCVDVHESKAVGRLYTYEGRVCRCLTPLKIGHVALGNAYRHITQSASLALVFEWGVPDLLREDVIQRQSASVGFHRKESWGGDGKILYEGLPVLILVGGIV